MKKGLTRTRYAQLPIDILEKYGDRKGVIIVYCWLWHYAGRDDHAFPSVDRLAAECRMKADDVRRSLKLLANDGWIERVDRTGSTTLFHVRADGLNPSPKWGTPPPNGGPPEQGTPPLPQMGDPTPPPKGGPNKKHLTKTNYQEVLEPPCIPPAAERRSRVATHPDRDQGKFFHNPDSQPQVTDAQPQPTQPIKPWQSPQQPPQPKPPTEPQPPLAHVPVDPKPKRREGVFMPTEGDVPAALLPVFSELLEFWSSKGGKRTQRAWALQLTELARIQDDPAGGTDQIREQLLAGAQAAVFGKPWMAVTHANWQRYRGRPSGAGAGFKRRMNQDEHAAEALAFIRARDARRAAEAAQQAQPAILAEVA